MGKKHASQYANFGSLRFLNIQFGNLNAAYIYTGKLHNTLAHNLRYPCAKK